QYLNYKGESMIPWFYLLHTIRTIPRGRQPNWYKQIVEMKEWITLKAHQAGFIGRISSLKKDNTALIDHWTLSHTTQTLQPCPGY
ncbi:27272_t:CDS:2, partial [Gigaspora margarita]